MDSSLPSAGASVKKGEGEGGREDEKRRRGEEEERRRRRRRREDDDHHFTAHYLHLHLDCIH